MIEAMGWVAPLHQYDRRNGAISFPCFQLHCKCINVQFCRHPILPSGILLHGWVHRCHLRWVAVACNTWFAWRYSSPFIGVVGLMRRCSIEMCSILVDKFLFTCLRRRFLTTVLVFCQVFVIILRHFNMNRADLTRQIAGNDTSGISSPEFPWWQLPTRMLRIKGK